MSSVLVLLRRLTHIHLQRQQWQRGVHPQNWPRKRCSLATDCREFAPLQRQFDEFGMPQLGRGYAPARRSRHVRRKTRTQDIKR